MATFSDRDAAAVVSAALNGHRRIDQSNVPDDLHFVRVNGAQFQLTTEQVTLQNAAQLFPGINPERLQSVRYGIPRSHPAITIPANGVRDSFTSLGTTGVGARGQLAKREEIVEHRVSGVRSNADTNVDGILANVKELIGDDSVLAYRVNDNGSVTLVLDSDAVKPVADALKAKIPYTPPVRQPAPAASPTPASPQPVHASAPEPVATPASAAEPAHAITDPDDIVHALQEKHGLSNVRVDGDGFNVSIPSPDGKHPLNLSLTGEEASQWASNGNVPEWVANNPRFNALTTPSAPQMESTSAASTVAETQQQRQASSDTPTPLRSAPHRGPRPLNQWDSNNESGDHVSPGEQAASELREAARKAAAANAQPATPATPAPTPAASPSSAPNNPSDLDALAEQLGRSNADAYADTPPPLAAGAANQAADSSPAPAAPNHDALVQRYVEQSNAEYALRDQDARLKGEKPENKHILDAEYDSKTQTLHVSYRDGPASHFDKMTPEKLEGVISTRASSISELEAGITKRAHSIIVGSDWSASYNLGNNLTIAPGAEGTPERTKIIEALKVVGIKNPGIGRAGILLSGVNATAAIQPIANDFLQKRQAHAGIANAPSPATVGVDGMGNITLRDADGERLDSFKVDALRGQIDTVNGNLRAAIELDYRGKRIAEAKAAVSAPRVHDADTVRSLMEIDSTLTETSVGGEQLFSGTRRDGTPWGPTILTKQEIDEVSNSLGKHNPDRNNLIADVIDKRPVRVARALEQVVTDAHAAVSAVHPPVAPAAPDAPEVNKPAATPAPSETPTPQGGDGGDTPPPSNRPQSAARTGPYEDGTHHLRGPASETSFPTHPAAQKLSEARVEAAARKARENSAAPNTEPPAATAPAPQPAPAVIAEAPPAPAPAAPPAAESAPASQPTEPPHPAAHSAPPPLPASHRPPPLPTTHTAEPHIAGGKGIGAVIGLVQAGRSLAQGQGPTSIDETLQATSDLIDATENSANIAGKAVKGVKSSAVLGAAEGIASKAAVAITIAAGVYKTGHGIASGNKDEVIEGSFGAAGAYGGALLVGGWGATAGTAVLPGVGTAIGGAAGAIIGGIAGSETGKAIGHGVVAVAEVEHQIGKEIASNLIHSETGQKIINSEAGKTVIAGATIVAEEAKELAHKAGTELKFAVEGVKELGAMGVDKVNAYAQTEDGKKVVEAGKAGLKGVADITGITAAIDTGKLAVKAYNSEEVQGAIKTGKEVAGALVDDAKNKADFAWNMGKAGVNVATDVAQAQIDNAKAAGSAIVDMAANSDTGKTVIAGATALANSEQGKKVIQKVENAKAVASIVVDEAAKDISQAATDTKKAAGELVDEFKFKVMATKDALIGNNQTLHNTLAQNGIDPEKAKLMDYNKDGIYTADEARRYLADKGETYEEIKGKTAYELGTDVAGKLNAAALKAAQEAGQKMTDAGTQNTTEGGVANSAPESQVVNNAKKPEVNKSAQVG